MKTPNRPFTTPRLSALLALLGIAAGPGHAALGAEGQARLEAWRSPGAEAGQLIYRGDVFDPRAAGAAPVYVYERRVATGAEGRTAAHVTRHVTGGEAFIAERAAVTPAYGLLRFDATNRQLGISGSVTVGEGGRRLDYRLDDNGTVSVASERIADPVVTGPSLHGFIVHHWDALAAGRALPVRMIVLAEKTTYGFEIRRSRESDGTTAFSITPSSWLVRLAVAPLTVTFDTASRNVVRYEGRVPPQIVRDGRLRAFDARVDYTMAVPQYR